LSELPTRDRALDPRPALRLLPTALLQDMCVAQKKEYSRKRTCPKCFKYFPSEFGCKYHATRCTETIPACVPRSGSARAMTRTSAVNRENILEDKYESSDSDEAIEKKIRREVRDTDSEMSDFQSEMDDAPKVCTGCGQDLDKTIPYECHLDDVQSEEQAGFPPCQYDDDKSVLFLANFQIMDEFDHLVRFETGLIERGKILFAIGVVNYIDQQYHLRIGPLTSWFLKTELTDIRYCLGTDSNYYQLLHDDTESETADETSNNCYFPFLAEPFKKLKLLNLTVLYLNMEDTTGHFQDFVEFCQENDQDMRKQYIRSKGPWIVQKLREVNELDKESVVKKNKTLLSTLEGSRSGGRGCKSSSKPVASTCPPTSCSPAVPWRSSKPRPSNPKIKASPRRVPTTPEINELLETSSDESNCQDAATPETKLDQEEKQDKRMEVNGAKLKKIKLDPTDQLIPGKDKKKEEEERMDVEEHSSDSDIQIILPEPDSDSDGDIVITYEKKTK